MIKAKISFLFSRLEVPLIQENRFLLSIIISLEAKACETNSTHSTGFLPVLVSASIKTTSTPSRIEV
jgi:hypothetical protein